MRALRVAILTPIVLPCDVEGDVPHSPVCVCVCVCVCVERKREEERKIEEWMDGEEGRRREGRDRKGGNRREGRVVGEGAY